MSELLKYILSNLIGWFLAILSIAYAFNESKKNKELRKLIRVNNWMFYQRTSNLGGVIQKALKSVKIKEIDIEIFEHLVRSDALCGELMKENIRLINMFELSWTQNDIDKWVSEGKISDGYADIFKKYIINDK